MLEKERKECQKSTYILYRTCSGHARRKKGATEYFPIEVGLYKGSALSPLLFIIMDVLTENIEKDPPWAMVFADDLVMCGSGGSGGKHGNMESCV